MIKIRHFLLIISFLFSLISFSQNLIIDGIISGYNYNPVNGIFKKGSNVLLEGRLENVSIIAFSKKRPIKKIKSTIDGEFHLELPLGVGYRVEVYKRNYGKIAFNIDLTKSLSEEDINFWSLELILNSHIPKKRAEDLEAFGVLGYTSNSFYFKEFEQESNLFSRKIDYNPLVSLILESVLKNKPNVFTNKKRDKNLVEEISSTNKTFFNPQKSEILKVDNCLISPEILNSEPYENIMFSDENINLSDRELLIQMAKKQLEIDRENVKTPLDSLLINERELIIVAAETELTHLKEVIEQKEIALIMKNNQLILISMVLILIVILTYFVIRVNKVKTKLNARLKDKNKKITDSIIYAKKIQKAILPDINDLNKLLVKSFILFKPKDKVSGDYYWFEKIGDKIVIAAVDCTGHGVPGAFMSMIGNVLMNNIIIERHITSPKEILHLLNKELQVALRQDNSDPFSSQDGMDLSICVIDKLTSRMTYAGAMNPIYMVHNGKIEALEVDKRGVGGFDFFNNGKYTETTIKLKKNSHIYMLSDGYMDQFGGLKSEKYNLTRFREMILKCENKSIKSQKKIFESTLSDWQGDLSQTDDILVIGINL